MSDPTAPLGVQLWESSQAQSEAYATITNDRYAAYIAARSIGNVTRFAPGEGSVGPSTFFTNGNPPNSGNT